LHDGCGRVTANDERNLRATSAFTHGRGTATRFATHAPIAPHGPVSLVRHSRGFTQLPRLAQLAPHGRSALDAAGHRPVSGPLRPKMDRPAGPTRSPRAPGALFSRAGALPCGDSRCFSRRG